MKRFKRIMKVFVFILMLTMVAPTTLPISSVIAQAATVKLKDKALKLEIGETYTLKVIGAKSKVTWTSNKKSIATVSKKGKVTAIKVGTATITATVNKKEYTCKVTVKENSFVKNAPFDAKKVIFGKVSTVIPKDWKTEIISEEGNNCMVAFYPEEVDLSFGNSYINILIQETGVPQPDYKLTKAALEQSVTEDMIISQFAQAGVTVTISDLNTSDYEAKLGTAFKIEYTVNTKVDNVDKTLGQKIYYINLDNYLIALTVTDMADGTTLDMTEVGEYLLNSIVVK